MMKEELPNLIDERRFRRREPENFERDEFGRVYLSAALRTSACLHSIAQMAGREDHRQS